MEYKRFNDKITVRLDKDDEISESILKIAEAEGVTLGFISGIGATDDVTVGVFNAETKTYNSYAFTGTHEITSLVGNLTTKDGKPYCHLHITLAGEGGKIAGGHLLRGVISLTGEILITVVDGTVNRKPDKDLGINKMEF